MGSYPILGDLSVWHISPTGRETTARTPRLSSPRSYTSVPPCRAAISRAISSPRPRPERSFSRSSKASSAGSCAPGRISPCPSSHMVIRARPFSALRRSPALPPAPAARRALAIRLRSIRRSSTPSPSISTSRPPLSFRKATPHCRASGATSRHSSPHRAESSTVSRRAAGRSPPPVNSRCSVSRSSRYMLWFRMARYWSYLRSSCSRMAGVSSWAAAIRFPTCSRSCSASSPLNRFASSFNPNPSPHACFYTASGLINRSEPAEMTCRQCQYSKYLLLEQA